MRWIPEFASFGVVSLGMVVDGSVSFSSKRDRFIVREGFHSGHSDSRSNHVGLFVYREDDCNWDDVIPRVSKSAGFWSVGQWFQVDVGNMFSISLMRCSMNCFSGLLLLIQCRTISLSDQSFTLRLGYLELRVQDRKLANRVPTTAAINSNWGRVSSFNGTTRDCIVTFEPLQSW